MTVATTELQVKKPSIKWGHIFAGIYLYAYERERLLICAILVHSPLLASVGLFYDIKQA